MALDADAKTGGPVTRLMSLRRIGTVMGGRFAFFFAGRDLRKASRAKSSIGLSRGVVSRPRNLQMERMPPSAFLVTLEEESENSKRNAMNPRATWLVGGQRSLSAMRRELQ